MRIRDEQGQALVETAVSMGLFIVLMLGAVEVGSLAYTAMAVNSAAKAAAQYGSQNHSTAIDQAGMLQSAKSDSNLTGLTLTSPSGTPPTTATSANGYTCSCADTGTVVSCTNNSPTSPSCSGSFVEVTILVQTQVTYHPLIQIPALPTTFTLYGRAKQQVLQ